MTPQYDYGNRKPAGTSYEAATGRPIRYSINGRVEEPDGAANTFMEPMQRLIQECKTAEEQAIAQMARMLSEISSYDHSLPEDCPLKVGGFWFWKNPEDLARVKAYKANQDRGVMLADLMRIFTQLGEYSHHLATEADQRMWERNRGRPPALQNYGEFIRLLTNTAMGNLIKEMLIMYPNLGMASIAKTTFKKKK
jgi:hypothetical protein